MRNISYGISRSFGAYGNVTVYWRLTSQSTVYSSAAEDFHMAEGNVSFFNGDKNKVRKIVNVDLSGNELLFWSVRGIIDHAHSVIPPKTYTT